LRRGVADIDRLGKYLAVDFHEAGVAAFFVHTDKAVRVALQDLHDLAADAAALVLPSTSRQAHGNFVAVGCVASLVLGDRDVVLAPLAARRPAGSHKSSAAGDTAED